MNTLTRLSLAVACFILTIVSASAQFDTTRVDLLLWGKLVSATPTSIVIDATRADGTTGQASVQVTSATQIGGCTLDSVQPGTYTLVQLNPSATTSVADFIKFDGCAPTIAFMGRVESTTASGLRITTSQESELGAAGTTVDVAVSASTSIFTCDGYPLGLAEITPLTEVSVNGVGSVASFSATAIQTFNDCSQTVGAEATFVAYRDSLFIVAITATSDTLELKTGRAFSGVPVDSGLVIFSCDGRMLSVDELAAGDPLNIVYLENPRRGNYLQYAQLQRNCPTHVSGMITAIDGDEVSVTSYGTVYTATVTNDTYVKSCTKQESARDDLRVGLTVSATILNEASAPTYSSISILDDCSFAFYIQGTVTSVTDSSIAVSGFGRDGSEQTLELTSTAGTLVTNCLNEPQPLSLVQPGNTVGAYYSLREGQTIADLIVVMDPCTIAYIGGTIQAVTASSIALFADGPQAVVTLLYNSATAFSNCADETITLDSSLIGKTLFGVYNTASDPALLTSATINVGCPAYGSVEGVVVLATDSSIAVQTTKGLEDYLRSAYVSVYDTLLQPLDWSEVTAGRTVCMTVDEQARIALRVFVDQTCDALPNGPRVSKAVGKVVDATETTLWIETRNGISTYLLTDDTRMMTSSESSVTFVPQGAMVSIMCMDHTPTGMPIAASVVVMDGTTSVDEDESSATSLAVSPNPASSTLTIAEDDAFTTATIIDMHGRTVLTSASRTINVASLPVGAYTVVVSTPRGVRSTMLQVVR
jgi:hypothetical protein